MSKVKHSKCKSKKPVYVTFLAIALVLVVLLIAQNVYSVQTVNLASVSKASYLLADNQTKQGKVYVNYVDEFGKVLSAREEHTGTVGEVYNFSRKKIDGYRSTGVDPVNKIGNYDEKDITVNFVYESRIEDVNTSTDGDTVNVQVVKNKDVDNQGIKCSIVTKNANGEIIKLAKYVVTAANQSVLRNSTSYVDSLIVGSLNLVSEGTDNYFIEELQAPNGYVPFSGKLKLSVNKTLNTTTGKYEVTADVSDTSFSSVAVENGEIVITVVNALADTPEPERIFDLEMHKSITKAIYTLDGKEEVIEKNDDSLIKVDVPRSKIDKASIKVFYKLEVKNVGEVAGYAKEITEIIPNGMELVNDGTWIVEDNIAITNALGDIRLEPGDSTTIEVVCNWKLSESNVGIKTNEASISVYYNDEGLEDNTPDNNDKDSIMATIKTGGKAIITIEVVLALVLAGGIVYVLKRKNA